MCRTKKQKGVQSEGPDVYAIAHCEVPPLAAGSDEFKKNDQQRKLVVLSRCI
jgi:hypothetical protein